MSLLGALFGDSKKTTTTTSNTLTTVNNTASDSYNSTLNQTLSRNDSFINAPVTNTALDFINTYNLANTGNINGADAGSFADLGQVLDLNAFFSATQPKPASANLDFNSAKYVDALAGLQDKTLQGQAGQTAAATNLGNSSRWITYAAIAGVIGLVAIVFIKFRKG